MEVVATAGSGEGEEEVTVECRCFLVEGEWLDGLNGGEEQAVLGLLDFFGAKTSESVSPPGGGGTWWTLELGGEEPWHADCPQKEAVRIGREAAEGAGRWAIKG